ncbi:hypothetical protein A3K73_09345 [Candidatus Pacearchaeota archaeon RBG_13_36_9]|nr:MAG: hypothetical protein A3K73_09345 [Candidatus Pacearchaeota archaeon RBG_13_36_9]
MGNNNSEAESGPIKVVVRKAEYLAMPVTGGVYERTNIPVEETMDYDDLNNIFYLLHQSASCPTIRIPRSILEIFCRLDD